MFYKTSMHGDGEGSVIHKNNIFKIWLQSKRGKVSLTGCNYNKDTHKLQEPLHGKLNQWWYVFPNYIY